MSKRSVLAILIPCFTIALLSGCAENPADKTTPAKMSAPFEETTAAAEGTVYALANTTSVEFVGSKVTRSHEGGFKTVTGTITVPDGDLTRAQIKVLIGMTSLWSDSGKLTGHLKTRDFFEVDTYPESTFISTSITATDSGFSVNGNLTLHGVTKGITFPATITISESKAMLNAAAEFHINRTDFGIEYKGKIDDLIRKEVVLRFNLQATATS